MQLAESNILFYFADFVAFCLKVLQIQDLLQISLHIKLEN